MKEALPEVDWSKHPSPSDLSDLVWSRAKSPEYRPFNNSFMRVKKEMKVAVTEAL